MTNKGKKSIDKEQKVIVNTKEDVLKEDNEINDRINRLYGLSSDSPNKHTKEYSEEELVAVRKKLVFLLGGVIVAGLVILFLLINPFFTNTKDNNNSSNNTNEESNNNEENNSEEENQYLGDLALSNQLVEELNNRVSFTYNDFKEIDLFPLYSNESIEIANVNNDIKLYLLKRDNVFREILSNNGVGDYISTCDTNGISIDKSKLEPLVKMLFGPNYSFEYKNMNYIYYDDYSNSKKITLSYGDDKYIVKCNDFQINETITKFVQQKTKKAIGTETSIEIYQKVVFISEKGVYKDTNFKTLITNDKSATIDSYIDKGNTYKYTFTKDENNYYLSKIELVKEDN